MFLPLGLGVREGFLEEVHLDSEYILLREEGQRDIPIRGGGVNRGKEMGGKLVCWELHGAQWTRRSSGEMQEGSEVEVGSWDAVYPHFILQTAGSLGVF